MVQLTPPPNRNLQESEAFFEKVRDFFWRRPQRDFVIKMAAGPMETWELVPTPTVEDMINARARLFNEPYGFAGFETDEDGYTFYYYDANILKAQCLDTLKISYFRVNGFSGSNLKLVVRDLRLLLQGS